jgi:hypothetical protein
VRLRTAALLAPTLLLGALVGGCDTFGSDFNAFVQTFNPPSPAEAAEWALDPYDAENRRRGTTLIQNAPWGGSEVYLRMYRDRVENETDPQVLAISLRGLGRWGTPADATLIATRLTDRSTQVRWEAAKALQRLHNPAVIEALARTLVNEEENVDVRTAAAIALGQYATDRSFQALALALDSRELAVDEAAMGSLEVLTDQRFGPDRAVWLGWYSESASPFSLQQPFNYPVYLRKLGILDYLAFWDLPQFETSGPPAGLRNEGAKSTYETAPAASGGTGGGNGATTGGTTGANSGSPSGAPVGGDASTPGK